MVGRARLYQHLPVNEKKSLPILMFGDNQVGNVAMDYILDNSFSRNDDGSINLWNVYNLFGYYGTN
jgi:hypothetical protein